MRTRARAAVGWTAAFAAALACALEQSPEERFWSWFAEHAGRLRWVVPGRREPLAEELASRLAEVQRGLVSEIRGKPGEARQLVLSANGVPDLFPAVERLAESAPEIEGWEIVAFRPARGLDFKVSYDGFELTPDELWFAAVRHGQRIDLRLYLPGVGGPAHRLAVGAARTLLETVLGEHAVGTRIGAVEHYPLPADPRLAGLHPLGSLPALVTGPAPR